MINFFNDPVQNIAFFLKREFCEGCKFNYPSQKDHDFCFNNDLVYKWAEELIICYKSGQIENCTRFVSPFVTYDVLGLFQIVKEILDGSKSSRSI